MIFFTYEYDFYFLDLLNFWQDRNDPNHSFSRDSADKSIWYEKLSGKTVYSFKLISQIQDEVLLFDGNRGYSAFVKFNAQTCLFSVNKDIGFYGIYSGFWRN